MQQDDHDLENGPEEGEYHFSDEGVYETQLEEAPMPEVAEKTGMGTQFSSYRRFIILGGIFAGILLVVYLLITPPTTPTPTEITAAATPPPAPTVAIHPENMAATASVPKGPSLFNKVKTTVVSEKNKVESMVEHHAAKETSLKMPTLALPASVAEVAPSTPPIPQMTAPLTNNMPGINGSLTESPSSAMQVAAAQPPQMLPDKTMLDRLTALEEANAKMINQLNAEYAHRLADFDSQNKLLQENIRALTAKINSMEAKMTQWQQGLSNQSMSTPSRSENASQINISENNVSDNNGNTATLVLPGENAASANKANYTVQAIIPGRAWLRAENGDTVTVAEGDLLKGFGRVTKIDPYDGTIQVDTGTRMILLSYGSSDSA